jgi:hypothetical protein
MKFQHLKIGQQFSYQGETYVKSTPLVASHTETGQQKLIPRYADIQVLENAPSPEPQSPSLSLSSSQVRTAIDQYNELCLTAIQDILPQCDEDVLQAFHSRLSEAHKQILKQLKLEE